ncbi:hypothetical protein BJY00DRAFT_320084 [Aspergillus carlsbadensis]|nr:hypothetical protein BJY00DRAFT_320084 [Aspergillus carlsbadensis]
MAVEPPLLPISIPVNCIITFQRPSPIDRTIPPTTAALIHCVSLAIFSSSTIWSMLWALYGYSNPDQSPTALAPVTPYPGFIWLAVGFFAWLLYLYFIRHDASGSPPSQRALIIDISIAAKVVLAVAHVGAWYVYKRVYAGVHPSMLLLFLATQASFDVILVMAYATLRDWD